MIGVIGLIIGIVLGVLLDPTVPAWPGPVPSRRGRCRPGRTFRRGTRMAGGALRRPRVRDLILLERRRCMPAGFPGDSAGSWIRHDHGRRRCAGYSNFLEHRIDPPSAPEGLT